MTNHEEHEDILPDKTKDEEINQPAVGGRRRRRRRRRKSRKGGNSDASTAALASTAASMAIGGRKRRKTRRKSKRRKSRRKSRKRRKTRRKSRRRKKMRRRRSRRKTMKGGAWVSKNDTSFKNKIELNTKVMDPPVSERNIRISDVNVPGVQLGGKRLQRGGGSAMSIVPGWNDLVDIGNSVVHGGKNFYHKLNGDRAEKSPLANEDQFVSREPRGGKFPDIGNMHLNAEKQAAEYKL